MHVCSEPGCPEIQETRRCPTHTRSREQARGTRQQRGYGAEHEQARARMAPLVEAGLAHCWRCGRWLNPDEPWDAGHDDLDRTIYRGPECLPCNRATAGRHASPPRLEPRDTALRSSTSLHPPIPRGIPRRAT